MKKIKVVLGDKKIKEQGFKRMSWQEKEAYIGAHKHIPEIKSEPEILKEGVPVSSTIKGLLANVEDNVMELIELNKEIERLKSEIKALKEAMEKMRKEK